MSKITISVDNTADFSTEMYKEYNIEVINFGVVIGDKVFRDTEVKPEDIYRAVEVDGLLPKTNAALESDYRELFDRATQNGASVIHISLSGALSLSHDNALRAAKGLERVHVIDSKNCTCGTGILAIKASEMISAGKSVDEIIETISAMVPKLELGVILNDLKFVHKGGRASAVKLLGANLLRIRPGVRFEDGKAVQDKKFIGNFPKAVGQWTNYMTSKMENANKEIAFVIHTDIAEEIAENVVEAMRAAGFKRVIRRTTGSILTIHCGRNVIGICYLKG